ncbi:MAG: ABC transporter ATP-binding protein [Acidimicrobiales bacterium]|nr:ABC transporter ATP-binding protein [Acidimicrobiales bacterium]
MGARPAGGAVTGEGLLEAREISVTFGGLRALEEVDLAVAEGSLVGLIGPNGAGKTTFIDAVTGFVPLSGGRLRFGGQDLTGLPAHQRARAGLTRTFQSLELFDDLDVRENLLVAAERPRWWHVLADVVRPGRRRAEEGVAYGLELLGIADLASRFPNELSQGQRKLVGVARALASSPRLVLLDEPAAGLDSAESELLGCHLRQLLGHGITVLLVDHDMGLVLSVCDDIFVLEFGQVIAHGPPSVIRRDEAVIGAYLGEQSREVTARAEADLARLAEEAERAPAGPQPGEPTA